MTTDAFPSTPEFGAGACTCRNGSLGIGCAVCSTANIIKRFGGKVGTMRELGTSMGRRHREADAKSRHGLALVNTNDCIDGVWCAYCGFLELEARGIPMGYGQLTDDQILAHLRHKHPMLVRGWYGDVNHVSETSYSKTTPAHGRSDTTFFDWHIVTGWELDGASVILSDPDFGSGSRPTVPPHSVWTVETFLRYWRAARSNIAYCLVAPPDTGLPQAGTNRPAKAVAFFDGVSVDLFTVKNGRAIDLDITGNVHAWVGLDHHWPPNATLVPILSGGHDGQYVKPASGKLTPI